MAKIENIEIKDELLTRYLAEEIRRTELAYTHTTKTVINAAVREAVRDLIAEHKDQIIDTAIEKASARIERNGIKQLLEQMSIEMSQTR